MHAVAYSSLKLEIYQSHYLACHSLVTVSLLLLVAVFHINSDPIIRSLINILVLIFSLQKCSYRNRLERLHARRNTRVVASFSPPSNTNLYNLRIPSKPNDSHPASTTTPELLFQIVPVDLLDDE